MEIVDWDALGSNIARLRKLRRWTQKELADKISVHSSMITRWEKGQIHPKDSQVLLIAEALQVSRAELLAAHTSPAGTKKKSFHGVDQELDQLLEQVPSLEPTDREALKAVIQAMLIKSRVRDAVGAGLLAS